MSALDGSALDGRDDRADADIAVDPTVTSGSARSAAAAPGAGDTARTPDATGAGDTARTSDAPDADGTARTTPAPVDGDAARTPDATQDAAIELANRLFDYAREGRTAELAAYLDAGAPIGMRNAKGDTMLTLAAYHGRTETVAMLVEHGAEIEAANDRGQRALTCAVFKQDAPTTRVLLAAGADEDAGQPTARATAEMFGWPEFDALLAERG